MQSSLRIGATLVANEFIDEYMAQANGEYVKVYLYLLRHQEREVSVSEIADALNHTEGDIRRALTYWKKAGVLVEDGGKRHKRNAGDVSGASESGEEDMYGKKAANVFGVRRSDDRNSYGGKESGMSGARKSGEEDAYREKATDMSDVRVSGGREAGKTVKETDGRQLEDRIQSDRAGIDSLSDDKTSEQKRPVYTPEQMKQLSATEEDFSQLLYIAQKYMNIAFTYRECEVFAYLYDGLHLSAELLEYLVEYCVQNGHTSMRYLETVGINWHKKGINTVEAAKQYTASYSAEGFAVMRAFGISDRRPGDSEMEMIRRWFREWGFTKELVMEACARTLKSTNKPSFAYADRILLEWKKTNVRTMEDVRKRDAQHEELMGSASQAQNAGKTAQPADGNAKFAASGNSQGAANSQSAAGTGRTTGRTAPSRNRFHNFEQRDTNYDAMVLQQLKERLKEQ